MMDNETRWLFERTCYGVPKTKKGHVPKFRTGTGGTTLRGDCSCGAVLIRAKGCNRAGLDYAIGHACLAYQEHVK